MAYPLSERMAGAFNKKPDGSYPFVFGPGFSGFDLGNAASFSGQGTKPQLKTKLQQDVERIRPLIPEKLRGRYDLFTGQGGDPNKFDVQNELELFRQGRLSDLEFQTRQAELNKLTAPPTTDPANPLDAAVGRYLDKLPTQPSFDDIRGALREDADYRQKLAKDSAKTAFQYEMMGRIPDTIMAGLAGSGQLMREGAKDISNTVMRGVEALPQPRLAVQSYQNPTFKYFQ